MEIPCSLLEYKITHLPWNPKTCKKKFIIANVRGFRIFFSGIFVDVDGCGCTLLFCFSLTGGQEKEEGSRYSSREVPAEAAV